MKTKSIVPLVIVSLLPASAQVKTDFHFENQDALSGAKAEARVESRTEATGGDSHVERKSVTVTSENGRTVRKTTTFRDGKEETITEILDDEGNVIATDGEENDSPSEPREPEQSDEEGKAWLGVRVDEAGDALRDQLGLGEGQGVVIQATAPDGPAAKSGLRANDILLKIDETALGTPQDLRDALAGCQPGQTVNFIYLRRGNEASAGVTLEEEPSNDGRRRAGGGGVGDDRQPGGVKIEIHENSGRDLDALWEDPNIPDEFKKTIREMLDGDRAAKAKAKAKAGAAAGPGGGEMKIEIRGDGFEDLLDNPQVPEEFKKTVREMLDQVLGDSVENDDAGCIQ